MRSIPDSSGRSLSVIRELIKVFLSLLTIRKVYLNSLDHFLMDVAVGYKPGPACENGESIGLRRRLEGSNQRLADLLTVWKSLAATFQRIKEPKKNGVTYSIWKVACSVSLQLISQKPWWTVILWQAIDHHVQKYSLILSQGYSTYFLFAWIQVSGWLSVMKIDYTWFRQWKKSWLKPCI